MSPSGFKSHTKSRRGCLRCKERKVKCDELRPRCTACLRREDDCVYPSPFTNSHRPHTNGSADDSPSRSSLSSSARSPDQGPVQQLTNLFLGQAGLYKPSAPANHLEQHDLRLLWHYMRVLSMIDASEPIVVEIRQVDMVEEALRHPFLMEAILSASALHLRSQNDDTADWALVAELKKSRALAGYMNALDRTTDDNVLAAFLCSVLLPVTFFATAALDIAAAPHNPDLVIQSMCTVFRLQSGIAAVMKTFRSDRLWKSRSCTMMMRSGNSEPKQLPPDTVETFGRLRKLIEEHHLHDAADRDLYLSALDNLERCISLLSDGDRRDVDTEHIFGWPVLNGEVFIERVMARRPPAMALLSCYGAVLNHLRTIWFINDWGRHIVGATSHFLDPTWAGAAAWAQRQIGT